MKPLRVLILLNVPFWDLEHDPCFVVLDLLPEEIERMRQAHAAIRNFNGLSIQLPVSGMLEYDLSEDQRDFMSEYDSPSRNGTAELLPRPPLVLYDEMGQRSSSDVLNEEHLFVDADGSVWVEVVERASVEEPFRGDGYVGTVDELLRAAGL